MIGKITSGFGFRKNPHTGKREFHNGVDIAVPMNTPILAPTGGMITEKWQSPKGGLSIAMLCNDGSIRFGFAHLQKCLTSVGDKVSEGTVIALSGNSGKSTGPHVHFTGRIQLTHATRFMCPDSIIRI